MAKLNTPRTRGAVSPLSTMSATPTARTHTGGLAYENDAKTELFRLGANLFAGESTFHDSASNRDSRFTGLVRQIAVEDPAWIAGFLTWLRKEGNVRTASIMGAAHAVNARLEAGAPEAESPWSNMGLNRYLVAAIPARADEPGEFAAYWSNNFGRNFPQPVKRGLADAATRLYTEFNYQKWNSDGAAWKFADVIQMSHAAARQPYQADLFELAIAERYGNPYVLDSSGLEMIKANKALRQDAVKNASVLLDSERLKAAGMTWEDVLSLAGSRLSKKEIWEALIEADSLGHMALIRNLRNMQEAGISTKHVEIVQTRISDPEQVAKGRQFPFRYYSAYKNANGVQWGYSLEKALNLSTQNIPVLSGTTDIHIDTSGSMQSGASDKSTMSMAEAAAVFGSAVAIRNAGRVRMFIFANFAKEVQVRPGDSVLQKAAEIRNRIGEVGHGTETVKSVRDTYSGADRVMIFTDMQSFADGEHSYYQSGATIDSVLPDKTWAYAFDLRGYQHGDLPSGKGRRHQLAGLTDGTFKMIPLLERTGTASWPWEK